MNVYVNYHNPDRMDEDARDVNVLSCVTNKKGGQLPSRGDFVFLIGRNRDDPRFFLYGGFIVSAIGPSLNPGFKTAVMGERGRLYRRGFVLDRKSWFAELKRQQQNF